MSGGDEIYFAQFIRPILLPMVLEYWFKCFNTTCSEMCELLPLFPWKCWGLHDSKVAQSEMGHTLASLQLTCWWNPGVQLIEFENKCDHLPYLISSILKVWIINYHENQSISNQWSLIKQLADNFESFRLHLMEASNICELIYHLLCFLALYDFSLLNQKQFDKIVPDKNLSCLSSVLLESLIKLYYCLNYYNSASKNFSKSDCQSIQIKQLCEMFHGDLINANLIDQLLQLATKFVSFESKSIPINSLILNYEFQLACWSAISNLIVILVFSSNVQLIELHDFVVWRLLVGHLNLLSDELLKISHFRELLSSLKFMLTQVCSSKPLNQDAQLNTALHHATVYTLIYLAKRLLTTQSYENPKFGETKELNNENLTIISDILTLLLDSNNNPQLYQSICQLTSFIYPNNLSTDYPNSSSHLKWFSKFEDMLILTCTCDRKNYSQLLKLSISDMNLFKTIYNPHLIRYPLRIMKSVCENLCSANIFETNCSEQKLLSILESVILNTSNTYSQNMNLLIMKQNLTSEKYFEEMLIISDCVNILSEYLTHSVCDNNNNNSNNHINFNNAWIYKFVISTDQDNCTSALNCLNIFNQIRYIYERDSFNILDPLSINTEQHYLLNSNNSITTDPILHVKIQILIMIAYIASIPNLSYASYASEVLRNWFNFCPNTMKMIILQTKKINTFINLKIMLAPYINSIELNECSTTTRNRQTTNNYLKHKEKGEVSSSSLSPLVFHLKNYVFIRDFNNRRSWLFQLLNYIYQTGLIQDDFFIYLQSLLQKSDDLAERLSPWLISFLIIPLDSNSSVNKISSDLKMLLLDNITNCLLNNSDHSNFGLTKIQMLINTLLVLHYRIQWIKRSGENINIPFLKSEIWLASAKESIAFKKLYETRLFLELAWLTDGSSDDWITSQPNTQEIWLKMCHLSGDLRGLMAMQIALLNQDYCTIKQNPRLISPETNTLLEQTRLTMHELLGNWTHLLVWHDKYDSNQLDSSNHKSPKFTSPQVANCLQHLGANKLFQNLIMNNIHTNDLKFDDQANKVYLELQEMRAAAAWRLERWSPNSKHNVHSSNALPIHPPESWNKCGLETAFYWIYQATIQSDWSRVSEIVVTQSQRLIDQLYSEPVYTSWNNIIVYGQQIGFLNIFHKLCDYAQKFMLQSKTAPFEFFLLTLLSQSINSINFSTMHLCPTRSDLEKMRDFHQISMFELVEPCLTLSTTIIGTEMRKSISSYSQNNSYFDRVGNLLIHSYLYFAEIAVRNNCLRLVQNWLDDANQCEKFVENIVNLNNLDNICREKNTGQIDLSINSIWRLLRLVKLQSYLEREHGAQHLAISRLQSGLNLAQQALKQSNSSTDNLGGFLNCYIHGMTILCDWLYESRTKSAADLLKNYLHPAMDIANRLKLNPDSNAFLSLAQFADTQFTTLDSYVSSSEFVSRRNFLTEAQRDVALLTDLGEKSRLLRLLQRQSVLEVDELAVLTSDTDHYLEIAISSYAQCLILSDDHNLKIYRLISLWLSASADQVGRSVHRNIRINKLISDHLPNIRADKFLPVIPQLAARLSNAYKDDDGDDPRKLFQITLMKLVERVIDWHPHHSAFTLLFLVNAELDELYISKSNSNTTTGNNRFTRTNIRKESSRRDPNQLSSIEVNSRIQAARQLYTQLIRGRRSKLLDQMQCLAEAYIELANSDVEKYRTTVGNISLPSGCKLSRFIAPSLKRSGRTIEHPLHLVVVPTCSIRIDQSGIYPDSNIVYIIGFAPDFQLAGGINLPKVINCLGSDGKLYRQLVKGKDDPRQDAVMQQVFAAANCLLTRYRPRSNTSSVTHNSLKSDNNSIQRAYWLDMDMGLRMRTYKVIPLAQRSGVIEWCECTIPLGEWLANEHGGAHQKYRPRDMVPVQAKQRLALVRDRPPERKRIVFEEICQKIKPVLGYFFLENFPNPESWYKSRMAYTRSLAVSNLVGYLVGLGDRHPHNILLHKLSGELIHIDLGVAFDQGRLLPTPEMVPFRLTRDLVHALGPLGLQAGFVPAAEAVLTELRTEADVILTLLQKMYTLVSKLLAKKVLRENS